MRASNPVESALAAANAAIEGANWRLAESVLQPVLAAQPDHPESNYLIGVARLRLERPKEAQASFSRALANGHHTAACFADYGLASYLVGDLARAEEAYGYALQIEPSDPAVLNNLGNLLGRTGRYSEACERYGTALEFRPDAPDILTNLGIALRGMGDGGGARRAFERALAVSPSYMPAYNSLAILLRTGNALDEALDVCELALSVCPDHPELLNTQAVVLYTLGQIAEAEASVRRSIALRPDYWTAWDNLLLFSLYRDDLSNAEIDSLHGEWASRLEASVHRESLSDRIDGFVPHGGRRLRVAFLSADFRFHPVARFVEPIFRALDRSRVEVYAYASNEDVDEVTAHLKDLVENWRDVARQSDRQLLERIRKDRIDVLFDLSGHTAGNRLGVLARRAAPTQISYLGYAHRTGLAAIDFRLVDSITDPAKHESGRGEAPIRIDGCFLCYAPAVDAGQLPTHSRSHVADRAGGIRFGSFNHLAKLSPMVLTLWAEILRKTPGSVLLIKSRGGESRRFRQRIRKVWRNAGLADERLQLIEHDPGYVEHLQRYRTIDIALDTYPYNGTTTTCDALWMGVPVITLAGARHASRVGASLLSACGHPELIAHSPVEYVNKAVGLAGDSRRLSALNAVLRGDIESSPVMDSAAFGRSFVTALERAVLMPHSSSLESVG